MKQSDKVVKKGNYYEIEVVEDGIFSVKPNKKEQSQSNIHIPSEHLILDLPSRKDAFSSYNFQTLSRFSNAKPDQLLHELEDILLNENLADEDKQQIVKLMKQIRVLKQERLVPLKELSKEKVKQNESKKISQIDLKVKMDLKDIQSKIAQLQRFTYPEISSLEHQLEVLLGEKKGPPSGNSSAPAGKDDRSKQEVDNLFAQISNLSCANGISGLVDKIYGNNGKYSEMAIWANNLEKTTSLHSDFLAELKEDEVLLNKLEANFKKNVDYVREVIDKLKKQSKK